jgi:clan AA aspartic protease
MGITYAEGVASSNGHREKVRFLVDSGASFTLLPEEIWRALGLREKRSIRIQLADGTVLRRPVGECRVEFEWGDVVTPVILGQPGDVALLGALTLEELGLVLHPLTRTLQPMEMFLPTMLKAEIEPRAGPS